MPVNNRNSSKEKVRKKKKFEEEVKEHQLKRSKNDIILGTSEPQDDRPFQTDVIAKDDETSAVKSSMQLTMDRSKNDLTLKDQSSCHSFNISTLENSSSKESHENSGDLFANDTHLSSDVDDIILDIKSINNVNAMEHANIQIQLPLKINTVPLDSYLYPVEKCEMMQSKDKIIINTEDADENGKSEVFETNESSLVLKSSQRSRKSSSLIEHEFNSSNLWSDGETQMKTSAELHKFGELQVEDVRNNLAGKVNDKAEKFNVSLNDVSTLNAAKTGTNIGVNELTTTEDTSVVSSITSNPSGDVARKSSHTGHTRILLQRCEASSASDSSDEDEYNAGKARKTLINKTHSKDKHIGSMESLDKVSDTSVSIKETNIGVECTLNKSTGQLNELMRTLESHNSDALSDESTSKLIINEDISTNESIPKVGMSNEHSNSIGGDVSQSSMTSAKDAHSVGTTSFGVESRTLPSNFISEVINKDGENVNSTSKTKNKTQQLQKSELISSDSDSSSSDDESVTKNVAFNTSITKHSLKDLEIPNIDNHSDKESSRSTSRIIKIQEFSDSDSSVPKPDYGKKIVPVLDTLSASKNATETSTCSNKLLETIETSNASKANKSAKEKEISPKVNKDIGNAKTILKMQHSNVAVCHENNEMPAAKTTLGSRSDLKCSIDISKSEVAFSTKNKLSDSSAILESVKAKQTVTKNVRYAKSKKVSSDSDSSMPSTDDEVKIRSDQRGSKKTIKSGNKSKNNKNTVLPVKQPAKIKALDSKASNKGLKKTKPNTQTPQKPRPICHDGDSSLQSSSDYEKNVAETLKSDPRIYTETIKEANKSADRSKASEVKPTKLKKIPAHAKGYENIKSVPKTQLPKRPTYDDSDSSMPTSSDENENIASKVKTPASMSNWNRKNSNGVKSAIKCDALGVPTNKESTKMKNSAKAVSKAVKVQQPPKPSYDSSMPSSDDEDTKPVVSGRTSKSLKPQTKSVVTKVVEKESTKVKKISQSSAESHNAKVKPNSKTKQPLKPASYDSDSSMPSSSDEDVKPAATSKSIKKKKVNATEGTKPTNTEKRTVSFLNSSDVKKAVAENATSRSSTSVKTTATALKTTAKCELPCATRVKQSKKKLSSKTVSKDTDTDSSLPSSSDDSAEVQIKSGIDEDVSIKPSNENKIALSKEHDIIKIPRRRVRIRSKDKKDCSSLKHYPAVMPKSKEFISSDSSDDDKNTVVPVIPLTQNNDGGMTNDALSKLTCQVVLTKLPASSLKSPPKLLITQENDHFSLKSSDEEDDIRILSAAVARSAQKAKIIKARSHQKATIKPIQLFATVVAANSDSSLDSSDSETEKKSLDRVTPKKIDLHNSDKTTKDRKSGRDLTDSSLSEQIHRKVPIHNLNVENFGDSVGSPVNNKYHSLIGRTSSETLKTVEHAPTHSDHMFTPSPNNKQANINKNSVFKGSSSQEKDATTMYELEQEENSDNICRTIVRALDLLHSDDDDGKISRTQQNHSIESQVSKTTIISKKLSKKINSNQLKDIKAGALATPSSMPNDDEKSNLKSSSVKQGKTQKQVQTIKRLNSTNDSADLRPAVDSIKVTRKLVESSKHLDEIKEPNDKSDLNNLKTSLESSKLKDDEHADTHNSKKKKKDKKRKHTERESSLNKANRTPNNEKSSTLDEPISKKTKFSETPAEVSQPTQDNAHKHKSQQKNSKYQTGIGESDDINQNSCVSPISSKVNSKKERKEAKKLETTKSSKQISKAKSSHLESSVVVEDSVKETILKHATERSTVVLESVSPMKSQLISTIKSKKRKRSSSSDVRDDEATFCESENQDLQKKMLDEGSKKKNSDLSSNSEDSQEEEEPVRITFKKMNILESISKVLSPRRGQISSTPINTAVRLKTPDASIIRPLSMKVKDSKAGESSLGKILNAKQVTKVPPRTKHQSSSESSSDSEMEVSRSLFN